MDPNILSVIIGAAALIVGIILGKFLFAKNTRKQIEEAELQSQTILKEAELRAETIRKEKELEAKEKFVQMKSAHDIVRDLMVQLDRLPFVGLLLHHKVMTAEAFSFLDQILCELLQRAVVQFHTFRTLLPLTREPQTVAR